MTLTLSETDVAKVLTYEQLISAMEKALFEFSAGRVIQPVRNLFAVEEGIAAASQVIVGKTMSGCSHFTIALF